MRKLTIHATLYGNHVDYVFPLAKSLQWSAANRPPWAWRLHVDRTVPRDTLDILRNTNPLLQVEMHEDGCRELWRYRDLIVGGDGNTAVAVVDADFYIGAGCFATFDKFLASAPPRSLWVCRPNYSYTLFDPKMIACFCIGSPEMPTLAPKAWDRQMLLLNTYTSYNEATVEAMARGAHYGFDEFFLTRYILPKWQERMQVRFMDLPESRSHAKYLTKAELRQFGFSNLEFHELDDDSESKAEAKRRMDTVPFRYDEQKAREMTLCTRFVL